jgi:hypothetical protein
MSSQSIQSDLLVELSIEQQELLGGGYVRRWGSGLRPRWRGGLRPKWGGGWRRGWGGPRSWY